MLARAIRPPAAATPTIAQSLARRTNFWYPQSGPGRRGTRTAVSSSSGSRLVSKNPAKKSSALTVRRPAGPGDLHGAAQRDQRHRQVRCRVGVREGTADRAPVPDLRVADLRRGVGQQRRLGPDQAGRGDVGVAGGGADHQVVAIGPDAGQLADPADVNHDRGGGQPQLHHRQQRMAPGQELGVIPVPGQQVQGVPGRLGCLVLERRGDHALIVSAAASTARTML